MHMFRWALGFIMDTSSSESQSDSNLSTLTMHPHKAHRRRFFTSIAKWFYTDAAYETGPNLDVVDLVIILQSLGFKLHHFKKIENIKNGDLKVKISCGVSDFEAVLSLPNISCKCPAVNNGAGEFWEVTGSGPSSYKGGSVTNVVNEAGSSLLPTISKATSGVVRDVMTCLFNLVNAPPDVNQNTEDNNLLTTDGDPIASITTPYLPLSYNLNTFSHTRRHSLESLARSISLSPEMTGLVNRENPSTSDVPPITIKSCVIENKNQPLPADLVVPEIKLSRTPTKLLRDKTYDVDTPMILPNLTRNINTTSLPRPVSAGSDTSGSPIPQICNRLNSLKLQPQQHNYKDSDVAFPLREARRNIDKALGILTNSKTPPSSSKKIPILKSSPNRPRISSYNPRNITPTFQKVPNPLPKSSDITFLKKRNVTSNDIIARLNKASSRLSLDSNALRPNTAPKSSQRSAIVAKRRVSPDMRVGTSSSTCSSTNSGSVGNLSNIGPKPIRNGFGYLPRSRTYTSGSSTVSPCDIPRKHKK